jgi:enoyl-CoA hydratase
MTVDDVVHVAVADQVATVTLNRPEARNALNRDLRRAIPKALVELDQRDDVAAIVLTGADPAFCAGVDLKEVSGEVPATVPARGPGEGPERDRNGLYRFLPVVPKPVIGAINGVAATGGLEIALQCTFLVASDRARFVDTHARIGIMPGGGITVLLAHSVGLRRAIEMSLTGNFVAADEALRLGLVNHVVPHDELLPFARKLATDIAGVDPAAVQRMLATYDEGALVDGAGAWALEAEVSDAWLEGGLDPAVVEANRQKVVARGRSQVS